MLFPLRHRKKVAEAETETETGTEKQIKRRVSTLPAGGSSASQTEGKAETSKSETPQSETPKSETPVEQPANVAKTTTGSATQDPVTGVAVTADTFADGTASVTTVADTGAKTLKVTGSVSLNGTSYAVTSFAPNAFKGKVVKK